MKFALTVLSPPHADSSYRALSFASSVVAAGHDLTQVFFYQDGVFNANQLATPPRDETCFARKWLELQNQANTKLYVCIASGIRRGIVSESEAQRHKLAHFNLAEGFDIVGLGQLMEASIHSDRLLTFA